MANVFQAKLSKLLGDGSRPSKFMFSLSNFSSDDYLRVKSTSIPAISHDKINLKYKGRTIPIRGQLNQTQEISVTFYLDDNHDIYLFLDNLIRSIDGNINYDINKKENKQHLKYELFLTQMDFENKNGIIQYTFHNAFITNISELSYSYDTTGTIIEFSATFSFSHRTYKTLDVENTSNGSVFDSYFKAKEFLNKINNVVSDVRNGDIDSLTNKFGPEDVAGDVKTSMGNFGKNARISNSYGKDVLNNYPVI